VGAGAGLSCEEVGDEKGIDPRDAVHLQRLAGADAQVEPKRRAGAEPAKAVPGVTLRACVGASAILARAYASCHAVLDAARPSADGDSRMLFSPACILGFRLGCLASYSLYGAFVLVV
jgi:hypothetical protein